MSVMAKARSGPCPRHVDEAHAAIGAVDAGNPRMQEGLVVEEIQMRQVFFMVSCTRQLVLSQSGQGKRPRS
jgi:hypothetical protein